ncbi:hypothetical protein WJX84_005062 [Apatococcus fuscideae]|uniref:Sister chromatid cohesion protein n=1 Tax=Apatococcus fuscideae TaxID=2026836 RepID=A0AAW1RM26_9CHLO
MEWRGPIPLSSLFLIYPQYGLLLGRSKLTSVRSPLKHYVFKQDLDEVQWAPAAKRRRTVASRRPADISKFEQSDVSGQLIKGLHDFLADHDLAAQAVDDTDIVSRLDPHKLESSAAKTLLQVIDVLAPLVADGHKHSLYANDRELSEPLSRSLCSCNIILHILTISGMPRQAFNEELLESIVDHLKHHLNSNIYPFYSIAHCQIARPDLCQVETVSGGKKRGSMKAATGSTFSKTIVTNGLEILRIKALELYVTAFQLNPSLQQALMDNVISSLLPNLLMSGRRLQRSYTVGPAGSASIQVLSAMLVQMLQAAASLPEADADHAGIKERYAPVLYWAKAFWASCLERLPHAKQVKADMDIDMRSIMEQLLLDVLVLQAGMASTNTDNQDDDASCLEGLRDSQVDAAFNLLLSHLAAPHHVESLLCSSARHFILSRRLVETLPGASSVDTPQLLAGVKQAAAQLDRGVNHATFSLTSDDAVRVDASLLRLPELHRGISHALQDESASVREAAVSLLGRHISAHQDLADTYFETMTTACQDSSTSVRKSALKILWEACIQPASFGRGTEACIVLLQHVNDPEPSIQDFVGRIVSKLWFPDQNGFVQQAKRLANIADAMFKSAGDRAALPLDRSHPLVAALCSQTGDTNLPSSQAVVSAALDGILQAMEHPSDSQILAFPFCLAIHAACIADVSLCLPEEDSGRFLRCLSPYIKANFSEVPKREDINLLLCLLGILDPLIQAQERIEPELAAGLLTDLVALISNHRSILVVSAACAAFCSLAKIRGEAADTLLTTAVYYHEALRRFVESGRFQEGQPPLQAEAATVYIVRYLHILGQLSRFGAELLDGRELEGEQFQLASCLQTILKFFDSNLGQTRVQSSAVQAMGSLAVARPALLLGCDARRVFKSVMGLGSCAQFQMRALNTLTDLLKNEENKMLTHRGLEEPQMAAARSLDASSGDVSNQALPVQNGQGDTLPLSSGILQDNWELVLRLATDVCRPAATGSPSRDPGHPLNAAVRRAALLLIEAVLRGGLVAPWTAIPTLITLTSDPNREVADAALKTLRQLAAKHFPMFHSQLSNGINLLAEFHWRLHHAFQPSVLLPAGAPAEVLRVENNLANIQDHAALQHVPAPACIPHAQQLRNGIRAGLAVSVLLVLKKYLKEAFSLAPDRVIAFEPKSEARKQEEKVPAEGLQGAEGFAGG